MHKMKERVCITVDPDLISKAKELKVNVSMVAEMALSRELDTFTKNAYTKALEAQNELFKEFLKQKSLYLEFEEFKYGVV